MSAQAAGPAGAEAAIELHGVTKVYPGSTVAAVDDLSFDVPAGELVVLVGPSGCGKTTTLRMLNRLEEPTCGVRSGSVGEDIGGPSGPRAAPTDRLRHPGCRACSRT